MFVQVTAIIANDVAYGVFEETRNNGRSAVGALVSVVADDAMSAPNTNDPPIPCVVDMDRINTVYKQKVTNSWANIPNELLNSLMGDIYGTYKNKSALLIHKYVNFGDSSYVWSYSYPQVVEDKRGSFDVYNAIEEKMVFILAYKRNNLHKFSI